MIYSKIQDTIPYFFEAVGCLCLFDNTLLLLKRNEGKSYPRHWGIPSGKKRENETRINAAIRELFEETGLIRSSHNLNFLKTYHIINDDMSFLYSLYSCHLSALPDIKINKKEHTTFAWYKLDELSKLLLVPDSVECVRDVLPYLKRPSVQLSLFSELYDTALSPFSRDSIEALEIQVMDEVNGYYTVNKEYLKDNKKFFVSFGPPAAGKTTSLLGMSKQNHDFKYVHDNIILQKKSRLNYYIHAAFEKKITPLFFHFQMEILLLRFLLTKNAPNNALVDESIFSTLSYSRALYRVGYITAKEYQTFYYHYLHYVEQLPAPEVIFYFNCPIDTLFSRIKRRGRKHEQLYDRNYIENLYFSFYEVSKQLKKDYKLVTIDTGDLSIKEVTQRYAP